MKNPVNLFLQSSGPVFVVVALAVVITLLTGCSDQPTGGISGTGRIDTTVGTGIILGRIDTAPGLSIDGSAFDSSETTVTINGVPGTMEDLRVGMSVVARVDYQQQKATDVEYQPLVSGPVTTTSDDKSQIEILGQAVEISDDTFLDDLTKEDIFQGIVIEINGQRDKTGKLLAEYIRIPADITDYFLVGDLAETPESTSIAGVAVDLESVRADPDSPELPSGASVKARIDPTMEPANGAPLTIVDAEVVGDVSAEILEIIKINGVVSDTYNDGSFAVRGFSFTVDDETVYQNRSGNNINPFSIQEGQKIRIIGVSISAQSAIATEIKLKTQ